MTPWSHEHFVREKPALVTAADASPRLYTLEALGQSIGGEEPVKLLREAMGRIAASGTGEAGHEPDAEFYEELARLVRGHWEGGADSLALKLRSVGASVNAYLPRMADLEGGLAQSVARRESVSRELEQARLARESVAAELRELEPDVARNRELSEERGTLEARRKTTRHAIQLRKLLLEMLDELKDNL